MKAKGMQVARLGSGKPMRPIGPWGSEIRLPCCLPSKTWVLGVEKPWVLGFRVWGSDQGAGVVAQGI